MFYWVIIVMLAPCVAYDWLTSLVGAIAFFGLQSGAPIYMWGIPVAISIGAIGMNFMTTEIFGQEGAPEWIKGFWFMCIVFDAYTTFLGLGHVKMGGGIFSIPTTNVIELFKKVGPEGLIVLAIATSVFVASPMACFWLWKKTQVPKAA